jgi:alcohol dehydrogenase
VLVSCISACGGCRSDGQISTKGFTTHRFDLDDFEEAYQVFARSADTGAIKVILTDAGV